MDHEVVNRWLTTSSGTIGASWYLPRRGTARDLAVVVVLGIALEDRTSAVGVRPLAERLAEQGVGVLVVQLEGTGQSTGDLGGVDLIDRWTDDVRTAVSSARQAGFTRVAVVGLQIGALMALTAAAVERVVLWAPVLDGRRFRREIKLIATTGEVEAPGDHTRIGAFEIPPTALQAIGTAALTELVAFGDRSVLVVEGTRRADDASVALLRQRGCTVEIIPGAPSGKWLSVSSELARIPLADLDSIAEWLVVGSSDRGVGPDRAAVEAPGDDELLADGWVERFVALRDPGVHGVLGGPEGVADSKLPTLLLLSSTGPGRSFVDMARAHQRAGGVSLRIDLSGAGTSPRHPGQGYCELYGRDATGDVAGAVRWLHAGGHRSVVVVGYCATAFAAIAALPRMEVAGVIAWNAELYVGGPSWRTSDGVRGPRLWRSLERLGLTRRAFVARSRIRRRYLVRTDAVRALAQPAATMSRVLLQYDAADLGFAHIEGFRRGPIGDRRRRGLIEVRSYPNLGHALGGLDARQRVIHDAQIFVEGLLAGEPLSAPS